MDLSNRVTGFGGTYKPCRHKHELQGTGGVFYQSVGLMQCGICGGWQLIRKPIRTK